MAETFQTYRRRIRSVKSISKITRAMELIAASRIVKARERVAESTPYAREITAAVSAAASNTTVDHPLLTESEQPTRAAMLLLTADRGYAGAYTSNVLKEGEALIGLLEDQGKTTVPYVCGTKGINWYKFRDREFADSWSGFTEQPAYEDARKVGQTLVDAFLTPTEEGGVDEIHIVYTEFLSMMTQTPEVRRLLPLEVEESDEPPAEGQYFPEYEFEPSAEQVLQELLPRYINSRIYNAMLQAAASEQAARQRAMKAATDNANELVETYTRLQNQARQGQITQEISEIVGGANALADATSGSE